jgi:hypothetical protein
MVSAVEEAGLVRPPALKAPARRPASTTASAFLDHIAVFVVYMLHLRCNLSFLCGSTVVVSFGVALEM